MYKYKAKVKRVVDGDTVDFDVDLGFHVVIRLRGRLLDVDTPERGHQDWTKATEMLEGLLKEQEDGEGYVTIHTVKTGKYGRWLIDIDHVNTVLGEIWPYE